MGDGQKLTQPLWLQKLFLTLATQDYTSLLFGDPQERGRPWVGEQVSTPFPTCWPLGGHGTLGVDLGPGWAWGPGWAGKPTTRSWLPSRTGVRGQAAWFQMTEVDEVPPSDAALPQAGCGQAWAQPPGEVVREVDTISLGRMKERKGVQTRLRWK